MPRSKASTWVLLVLPLAGCAVNRPDCVVSEAAASSQQGAASCAVVQEGKLLVVWHRYSGKLDLPGGMAKTGESAQCTAHRETWEETGIRVTVHEALPGLGNVFRCVPVSPQPIDSQPKLHWWSRGEVTAIRWQHPDEISPAHWRYGRRILDLQDALAKLAPSTD
jgi:8-oxo-dGTP pyrophosphatase MutT (NUDIX family)